MIPVKLENLIHPEAAARLKTAGMHKVAAALLNNEGFSIGEELTIKQAVAVLGFKLRQKNAEWARIHESLSSLASLESTKTADRVSAMVGAAALGTGALGVGATVHAHNKRKEDAKPLNKLKSAVGLK